MNAFSRKGINPFGVIYILLIQPYICKRSTWCRRKAVIPNETSENVAHYKILVTVKTTKLIEINIAIYFSVYSENFTADFIVSPSPMLWLKRPQKYQNTRSAFNME